MIDFIGLWGNLVRLAFKYFERPYLLLIIIPVIIFLVYFIRKDFIKLYTTKDLERKKKNLRIYVLISRIFVILFLLVALASPYAETTKTVKGDPKIKILVDNSTSMELFDLSLVDNLQSKLESRIPIELAYISMGDESRLGDGILANMRRDDNLLLITDGNNNKGIQLGDVVIQANAINTSISSIALIPNKFDASVLIFGPDKIASNVDSEYLVEIKKTENRTGRVIIEVDGSKIFDDLTYRDKITFKRSFANGYHKITASLLFDDYFTENNIFYKTVKVVPKPKVLLATHSTELQQLFDPLYGLDIKDSLDRDYNKYTAIVIDDLPVEELENHVDKLINYVIEGNGLFVAGGRNSYDFGSYNSSRFEQLLPIFVAKAGRQRGEINIVFVMDISQSTGEGFGGFTKVDVEKALAIGMLNNISYSHNVGFIVFNTLSYKLADLKPLVEHADLQNKIHNLKFFGGTNIVNGLLPAIDLLQNMGGSKNIILISDGRNNFGPESILTAVDYASSLGIRIYTVGVGSDTNTELMKQIADLSNAAYFEPDTTQRIKVLFGDIEISADKKIFSLNVVDDNHFITQNLDLSANIYGFNQVVPKNSAKMLVATDVGDPILTVWRFGLGRVASLASDTKSFGFELLNKDNSVLLTRINNWAIGDPERKNDKFIDIPDGRIGEPITVTIRSSVQPRSDDVALYKIDENLYSGVIHVKEVGFKEAVDAVFAVNHKSEYDYVGINPGLNNIASATNGRIFDPEDINGIVDFVKQRAVREILTNKSYSWIFLFTAVFLYLVEVIIRRLVIYKIL